MTRINGKMRDVIHAVITAKRAGLPVLGMSSMLGGIHVSDCLIVNGQLALVPKS